MGFCNNFGRFLAHWNQTTTILGRAFHATEKGPFPKTDLHL